MQSKIRRKTPLRPPATSRIRREPVVSQKDLRDMRKAIARSKEREMWGGVAGVMMYAGALALVAVGIAIATFTHYDPTAAAADARFNQCYSGGQNCVVDGNSIYFEGTRLNIAGIDAPRIMDAKCDAERSRGIDAATRLAELLNSGTVTVGPTVRDEFGRDVRKVEVNGNDVAATLADTGAVRRYDGTTRDWCEN